jgi:membrane dipeptidase
MSVAVADPARLRDALALLDEAQAVDLHTDTFIAARMAGYDAAAEHSPRHKHFVGHVDLPRARRGGLKGALWSITTNPFRTASSRQRTLLRNLQTLRTFAQTTPAAAWVTSGRSFDEAMAARRHAIIPVVQGANALGDSDSFGAIGATDVVSCTLVHLLSSAFGETSTPLPAKHLWGPRGLTARGRALVTSMNAEGILIDLAHAAPDTFWDTIGLHDHSQPIAVTHTGLGGVYPHWRNIDDAQLKAVADTGGVVGVIFHPGFLGPKDGAGSPISDGIGLVVRHLAHIIDTVGEDHAALGSDWDGFIVPPDELKDPLGLPLLVAEMQARGYRPERIHKILGGNFVRCLRALRPG